MGIIDRIAHAWNAFKGEPMIPDGPGYSVRPDRPRLTRGNERTIVSAIYNRIALDVAQVDMVHCKTDSNGRYTGTVNDSLNQCLTIEANPDQSGRDFMHDVVMSMFDEGCVAIVPTHTDINPMTRSYDINELRTAKIVTWYPNSVKVNVYDEEAGCRKDIVLPKAMVAIVENPFYAVMNEPNSTYHRLTRKLAMLDMIDEQSASGKLNMIIQLPYSTRSNARTAQAEKRVKNIEMQLVSSKYGIAYIDSTEKITQLNKQLENHLLEQIEYLTNLLYSQLGINTGILDGTADDAAMNNYNNRILEPILSAIADSMKRKFLTKTARTQGHSIMFFRNILRLVPVSQLGDLADKLTRNAIVSSNEIRAGMGLLPSEDPDADALRNKNLNQSDAEITEEGQLPDEYADEGQYYDESM